MNFNKPPFSITPAIEDFLVRIGVELGRIGATEGTFLKPHLRRKNLIQTIQASLQIEQNTLTVEQVTAVLEGKPVRGLPREILEVKNAFVAYEQITNFNHLSTTDILKAHKLLMNGLVENAGSWRQGGVGIMKGKELVHLAPPASQVSTLMNNLVGWITKSDTHPLIASSVFHYEFEFIHPFEDGNGRMGRLWQTVILSKWNPLFLSIPVETIVRDRQQEYYAVLAKCDEAADSTAFIEFMLQALLDSCGGVNGGVKSIEEQILFILSNSETPLKAAFISEKTNIPKRTIERALSKLKSNNRIEFVGAPKTGGYVIKKL